MTISWKCTPSCDSDVALPLHPHQQQGELTASLPLPTDHWDIFLLLNLWGSPGPLALSPKAQSSFPSLLFLADPMQLNNCSPCVLHSPGQKPSFYCCLPRAGAERGLSLSSRWAVPFMVDQTEHAGSFPRTGGFTNQSPDILQYKNFENDRIYHRIIFSIHFLRTSESYTCNV